MEQLFPLGPLRLAGGNVGIEALIHIADSDAILCLGDEFPLLPKHFLKAFDLVQKVDDPAADGLDRPRNLEPALGAVLAGAYHLV